MPPQYPSRRRGRGQYCWLLEAMLRTLKDFVSDAPRTRPKDEGEVPGRNRLGAGWRSSLPGRNRLGAGGNGSSEWRNLRVDRTSVRRVSGDRRWRHTAGSSARTASFITIGLTYSDRTFHGEASGAIRFELARQVPELFAFPCTVRIFCK